MATDPARITTPERTSEDQDQALRPKTLDEFVGIFGTNHAAQTGLHNEPARAEADDGVDRQRIGGAQGARGRQLRPSGKPQGEVPARRMAGRDETGEIQPVSVGMAAQGIGGRGDVEERVRKAAAAVDAAIFDIPDGDPAAPQIVGDPVHDVALGDFGLPAAAMDHQDDGMGAVVRRKPQIDDLQRVVAIGNSQ